jgi:hypothetical protein
MGNNPITKVSFKELKARTINRWLTDEEEKALLKAVEGRLCAQYRHESGGDP